MQTKRLLKLANFLDTVKSEKFNLASWVSGNNTVGATWTIEDIHTCGFTGCAIGWAMTIPSFRKAGLYDGGWTPAYKGNAGWSAVDEFFGINRNQSHFLFHMNEYKYGIGTKPKTVANRIRKFVEKNAKA